MRKPFACVLKALPLAALAVAAPLLLLGGGAGGAPPPVPKCGIAAWTGACVCAAGPHGASVPLAAFERSHPDPRTAAEAARECRAG